MRVIVSKALLSTAVKVIFLITQSDLSESHVCSFLSPVKNDLWLGIFCTIKSSHPHKIVR